MKEFMMFPSVCWTAKPMMMENTAKDASTPERLMDNCSAASTIPMAQTVPRARKTSRGLEPSTLTSRLFCMLSRKVVKTTLMVAERAEAEMRMSEA